MRDIKEKILFQRRSQDAIRWCHVGKNFLFFILSLVSSMMLLSSCTKDITIFVPSQIPQMVVEGHIETGLPPYVLITKSTDFYSTLYLDSLDNYYVHGATVKVSDGTDTVTLQEISLDTAGTTISVYVGFGMVGQVGKSYSLLVQAEGQTLSSVTTIPTELPLDSIWWEIGYVSDTDTFVKLICRYTDPPQQGQYVRYFTKENSQPFYPGLSSVFSDDLVNGTTFDFSLDRGVSRNDTTTYYDGYFQFQKGDTVVVKWCAIDEPHYNFWRTVEFELGNQGNPFATPTIIQGNVTGALGIWGGYASTYKSMIIPK